MEQNCKAGQNPPRVVAPTEEEEEEEDEANYSALFVPEGSAWNFIPFLPHALMLY